MPWSGSGVYNRVHNWVDDRDAAIPITASRMDAEDDSIAGGITNCITKDGQNEPTAVLPMGGFRHTGVGNAQARNNYAAAGQVQDGAFAYATDSGAANAYAISPSPAITAYAAGQVFRFIATNANTGASTLAVSGLAAKAITKGGTTALAAGDIPAGSAVEVVYDGTRFQIANTAHYSPDAADADTLDGQEGAFYQNSSNQNAGTLPVARLTGTYNIDISGNAATATTASAVSAGSIAQASLKTTTGEVSTSAGTLTLLTLPGGEYGFYPQLKAASGGGNPTAFLKGSTGAGIATAYTTYITLDNDVLSSMSAQQRYVQASPPYDLGDGDIPLFLFALVDANGAPVAVYSAPEAPWHHNGPTKTGADFYDEQGRGHRLRRDMSGFPESLAAAKASSDPGRVAAYMRAFREAPLVDEIITQDIKQADMPLIPHPFVGFAAGLTPVMIDGVSPIVLDLFEQRQHDGFSLHDLLYDGYLQVGNVSVNRAGPPGVPVHALKWRNKGA